MSKILSDLKKIEDRAAGHAHLLSTAEHAAAPKGASAYAKVSAKLAVATTKRVGSMTCAYIFCVIALASLPATLAAFKVFQTAFPSWVVNHNLIGLVAWIAQTFIQLVLLSVIMVGQDVQSKASDARAEQTYEDTEKIIDALRTDTEGGIKVLSDKLDALLAK